MTPTEVAPRLPMATKRRDALVVVLELFTVRSPINALWKSQDVIFITIVRLAKMSKTVQVIYLFYYHILDIHFQFKTNGKYWLRPLWARLDVESSSLLHWAVQDVYSMFNQQAVALVQDAIYRIWQIFSKSGKLLQHMKRLWASRYTIGDPLFCRVFAILQFCRVFSPYLNLGGFIFVNFVGFMKNSFVGFLHIRFTIL